MTISVGDKVPAGVLMLAGSDGISDISMVERLAGKSVVIFGLPGAYTGTCSTAHVPSFIRSMGAFKAKGVDARLLWYPDENHWILKPANNVVWYHEFFNWIRRYDPAFQKKKQG